MVVDIHNIIEATSHIFGIPKWRIFQRKKYKPIITMRVCIYHAADRLHHPYATIGRALGRDITTVSRVINDKLLTKEDEEKVSQIIELAQKYQNEGVPSGRCYQDCNPQGNRGRGSNAGPRTVTRARSRSYPRPTQEAPSVVLKRSQDRRAPISSMADRPHYRKPRNPKTDNSQSA